MNDHSPSTRSWSFSSGRRRARSTVLSTLLVDGPRGAEPVGVTLTHREDRLPAGVLRFSTSHVGQHVDAVDEQRPLDLGLDHEVLDPGAGDAHVAHGEVVEVDSLRSTCVKRDPLRSWFLNSSAAMASGCHRTLTGAVSDWEA